MTVLLLWKIISSKTQKCFHKKMIREKLEIPVSFLGLTTLCSEPQDVSELWAVYILKNALGRLQDEEQTLVHRKMTKSVIKWVYLYYVEVCPGYNTIKLQGSQRTGTNGKFFSINWALLWVHAFACERRSQPPFLLSHFLCANGFLLSEGLQPKHKQPLWVSCPDTSVQAVTKFSPFPLSLLWLSHPG